MSKATKKRIRRIENYSRFMTLEDGLSSSERRYLDEWDAAERACLVEFSEDFRGVWSEEDFGFIEMLRASLPASASSTPPSDAHLSARSKKKIRAVLQHRSKGWGEEMAKLERDGKLPVYQATVAGVRRSKSATTT